MTIVAYRGWAIVVAPSADSTANIYWVVMPDGVWLDDCSTASEAYALIDHLIRHPPTIFHGINRLSD